MSRVQLALNVSDIDAAVAFYSKLFATEPAKRRPGYANFAIAEPPLKLVLIEGTGQPGTLNHLGVEVEGTDEVAAATARFRSRGPGHRHRGPGVVLLRPAGQGVGRRPRRRAVGDLHRPGRRRHPRRRRPPHGRTRRRRHVLRIGPRVRRPLLLTTIPLGRRALAEGLGTGLLVVAVVGSGIAAERLSPGDTGLQLLENAAATAAALVAIILAVGAVSGAHLNPVVTLVDRLLGGLSTVEAGAYVAAQVAGAVVGAVVANLMYSLPAVELSTHVRSGGGLWLSEVVATFGLLLVILGLVRSGRASAVPFAVGAYIGGAYFFTSSTSFANPAVTVARALTDTFAGIAWRSVPAFVLAQVVGAALAVVMVRALYPQVAVAAHPNPEDLRV